MENCAVSIPAALAHHAVTGTAADGCITVAALAELAAEISRQPGQEVKYVNLPQADYQALLEQVGLPAPLAAMLANSENGAARGGLFDDGRQLSRLTGRSTTPLMTLVAHALAKG